jgi:hypothetical protein
MKRSYKKTGGHQSHLPKSQVGHTTLMKDVRAGPEDYKQLAERCMELASDSSAPTVAEALRALALDYLMRAAKLRRREPIESRPGRRRTGRRNRVAVIRS